MANPSGLSTGLENIGQTNNAYVVASWPANPAIDNVVAYDLQFYRTSGEFSGTLATAVTINSLTDTGQAWGVNAYVGYLVKMGGVWANVLTNTATILSLDSWHNADGTAAATPALGAYTLYHYVFDRIGNSASPSIKIIGLPQNVSYTFNVRAINNLGAMSPWSPDKSIVTALKSTPPAVPATPIAIKTPRGAFVSWVGVADADLQGYGLQVSTNAGVSWTAVFDKTLVTSFPYVAASGTATGTSLTFQVRSVDWSGNYSAWSATSVAAATDGIVIDELLVGNLKVYGNLSTGGLTTRGNPRTGVGLDFDATSLRLYDGTATNYGAPSGVGVTLELSAATGAGFFKGTLAATNILTGGIQSGAGGIIPTLPGSFTGFQMDASNGLRFFSGGALTAQFAVNGAINIYTTANITLGGGYLRTNASIGSGVGGSGVQVDGSTGVQVWTTAAANYAYGFQMNAWNGSSWISALQMWTLNTTGWVSIKANQGFMQIGAGDGSQFGFFSGTGGATTARDVAGVFHNYGEFIAQSYNDLFGGNLSNYSRQCGITCNGTAINQFYGNDVGFIWRYSSAPTSITLNQIAVSGANGIFVDTITLFGFNLYMTTLGAVTGYWHGYYTPVGGT